MQQVDAATGLLLGCVWHDVAAALGLKLQAAGLDPHLARARPRCDLGPEPQTDGAALLLRQRLCVGSSCVRPT
jgi:hypothetical protein